MPEGDTLYRTAARLRQTVDGGLLREARARPREGIDAASLPGRRLQGIESRGKHLLLHLDDRRCLHSHMGMTGSWHVYLPGEPWRKPAARAALVLCTDSHQAVCFSPRALQILSPDRLRRHPQLARLGPDLLAEPFDREAALERLRVHGATALGEALLNQTLLSGIGNVYKSEALFLCRLDPWSRVDSLDNAGLLALIERARGLMRRNLEGHRRRTRPGSPGGPRVWVYGRSGQPCLVCGTAVRMRRQGDAGRSTYFCPDCQRTRLPGSLRHCPGGCA